MFKNHAATFESVIEITSPIYRTRSIIVLDRSKNRPGVNE